MCTDLPALHARGQLDSTAARQRTNQFGNNFGYSIPTEHSYEYMSFMLTSGIRGPMH